MALITYWALFILAPIVAAFFLIGFNIFGVATFFAFLILLNIIGERGFRKWKTLFPSDSIPIVSMPKFDPSGISKIVAYKIDLGTEDEIRFDIYRSNGSIDVHSEEDPNFNSVIKALEHAYPNFDRQWHAKVSQPAFETCETVILDNA